MNISNLELRMKAKEKLATKSGVLAKATLIYGAIYIGIALAISIVFINNIAASGALSSIQKFEEFLKSLEKSFAFQTGYNIAMYVVHAIMAVFLAGIQFMALNVARGNEVKVKDVFHVIKNNPDKIIIIDLVLSVASLIFSLPVTALTYFADINNGSEALYGMATLFDYAGIAATFALTIMMSQCVFIFLDNPYENVFVIIKKSFSMMKQNVGRYALMWLSFLPLYIAVVFTLGIALLWVLPYQETSFAYFYMNLNGELNQGNYTEENEEKIPR